MTTQVAMKRRGSSIRGLACAVLCAAVAWTALGDGFRNPPPGGAGLGRAGVFIAQVDDGTAVSYNPANASLLEETSVHAGFVLARTETEFDGLVGSATSDDPWQPLPSVYAVWPLEGSARNLAVGLGITTPFGQSVEWDKVSPLMYAAPYFVEMRLVNVNPMVSAEVAEGLYVGVGGNVYITDLTFESLVDNGPAPGDGRLDLEGDGEGLGLNAGLSWRVTDGQTLALTYRTGVDVEYEGDSKLRNVPLPVPRKTDFETEINFPAILGLGYGIQVTEELRLEVDVEWVEFSRNESLELDTGAYGALVPPELPQDWDDTWTFGVAGDWRFKPNWILRAGYAFLESPIPDETFSPTLPDADRHVISLGLGYEKDGHRFDLAYAGSVYEDRDIGNNQVPAFNGEYEITASLLGISYNRDF